MQTPNLPANRALHRAWNKRRIVGQKRPLISVAMVVSYIWHIPFSAEH